MYQQIVYDRQGAVATITLNQPETYNALNPVLTSELVDAFERAREDDGARAIVITGAGRAFCSGGDLKAARQHIAGGGDPRHFFRDLTKLLHRLISDIRLAEKPVIAAVNGPAGGAGFSLALACDLRIAADTARFSQAYTAIGLVPDGGLSAFLPLTVGLAKASELLLLNPTIDAQTALALTIVNQVVPAAELPAATARVVEHLASGPTRAFALSKALLNCSLVPQLEAHLERERQALLAVSVTADFRDGLEAFFAKRPPNFQGR